MTYICELTIMLTEFCMADFEWTEFCVADFECYFSDMMHRSKIEGREMIVRMYSGGSS